MKEPKKRTYHWEPPDREWLESEILYNESVRAIARKVGVDHKTVLRWFKRVGIEEPVFLRDQEFVREVYERHNQRVREGYPNLF